jgi:hypothetical protein
MFIASLNKQQNMCATAISLKVINVMFFAIGKEFVFCEVGTDI